MLRRAALSLLSCLASCASAPSPASREVASVPPAALALLDVLAPGATDAPSQARYDEATSSWLVVDAGYEPGEGWSTVWSGVVGPAAEHAVSAEALEPALARLPATQDLVVARAVSSTALGSHRPLVQVGPDCLYVESDGERDTLHLFACDGGSHEILAERPAHAGVLDAAACARGDELACTEVVPLVGIESVRASSDGRTWIVQGFVGPAGGAGAGPYHWVVPAPRDRGPAR